MIPNKTDPTQYIFMKFFTIHTLSIKTLLKSALNRSGTMLSLEHGINLHF